MAAPPCDQGQALVLDRELARTSGFGPLRIAEVVEPIHDLADRQPLASPDLERASEDTR
jgi:hypothetical protein